LTEVMHRDLFLVITYIVVVFSILVQGLTVEKLVKRLGV
ncbi:MAG: CPA1 family monovalent cation:H+ antiporter, partial [Sphingobacteriales bacterium]